MNAQRREKITFSAFAFIFPFEAMPHLHPSAQLTTLCPALHVGAASYSRPQAPCYGARLPHCCGFSRQHVPQGDPRRPGQANPQTLRNRFLPLMRTTLVCTSQRVSMAEGNAGVCGFICSPQPR